MRGRAPGPLENGPLFYSPDDFQREGSYTALVGVGREVLAASEGPQDA